MKISKTHFINILRCRRYAALHEIYKQKESAIVGYSDDPDLDELFSMENKAKTLEILSSMYDPDTDEDLIDKSDPQLEMMQPYYDELELIAGRVIKKRFGGEVIYSSETYKQKRFNFLEDGYDFYCFLDGYQENNDVIRVFEVKSTTSSKFSAPKFSFGEKIEGSRSLTKEEFFVKNEDDIYVPFEDIGTPNPNSTYYKKESTLFDRFNERGKYIYDLAYQKYVIDKALKTNKKIEYYLVILNHEYVHDGKVDSDGNPAYDDSIIRFYNLTSLLGKMMITLEYDKDIVIDRVNKMDASPYPIGEFCNEGGGCPYVDICHADINVKYSILNYTEKHHGFVDTSGNKYDLFDLINKDHFYLALDVPEEYLNRSNNQLQRRVISNKKPYYNVNKIRRGIKELKYPIYHLDFESFNPPLPRFKGESPYTQSLFQFSIHVEREPGVMDFENDNVSFLAKDHTDQRENMLKAMLDVIKPDGGSVLTYNVSFERSRLKDLQKLFPQYFNQIENIIDRLFDLQYIVKGNKALYKKFGFDEKDINIYNFYHHDLEGSFSIKKVLPLFSKLSYNNLEVGNGTEAMVAYHSFPGLPEAEFKRKYNALLYYCKQDTWAMYEILNELRKI